MEQNNMENKVIKVAQIIGRTNNGGVENFVLNYFLNIDKSKVQFDFFVENECEMLNRNIVESNGGRIFIIPKYKDMKEYQKELKEIFIREKYDIVQANNNSLSPFALRAAKHAGIKIKIANSLSSTNKQEGKRYIIKNILKTFSRRYPTHYFACSNLAGTWLFGKSIVKNPKYYLVRNAVEIEKYTYKKDVREELIKKHNLQDRLVIGTIGRLEVQKNQTYLLDIFKEIHNFNNKAFLVIIGDGVLKEELEKKISKLNLVNDVLILTSSEVGVRGAASKYYSLFDAFVLPSLYEGLPTVGVEAQIAALPCFFSDVITKETTISSKCHYISLNESPKKWAEIILNNLTSNREIEESVYAYDIKTQAKNLEELYKKIVMEVSE